MGRAGGRTADGPGPGVVDATEGPRPFWTASFANALILPVVVVAVLLVVTINIVAAWSASAESRTQSKRLAEAAVEQLNSAIIPILTRPFVLNSVVAATIATQESFRPGDLTRVQHLLTELVTQNDQLDDITSFGFFGADGDVVGFWRPDVDSPFQLQLQDDRTAGELRSFAGLTASTPVRSSVPGYHPRQNPWWTSAVEARGPTWSPLYRNHGGGDLTLSATVPVRDRSGKLLGVQLTDLTLRQFDARIEALAERLGEGAQVYTVDDDGVVTGSSHRSGQVLLSSESVRPRDPELGGLLPDGFVVGTEAVSFDQEVDGVETSVAVVRLGDVHGLDWKLVVAVPTARLLGDPVTVTVRTLALSVLAAALLLIVAIVAARMITRPVSEVAAASRSISTGNLAERVPNRARVTEIRQLTDSFNAMASALATSFAEIEREARHDSVTGLLNRRGLEVELAAAATKAGGKLPGTILMISIDTVRMVRDLFGPQYADEVVRTAADRLRSLPPEGMLSRVSADEFLYALPGDTDRGHELAVEARDLVALPVEVDGGLMPVSASVGVVTGEYDPNSPATLYTDAAAALFKARREPGSVAVLDSGTRQLLRARSLYVGQFKNAMDDGQLKVFYQPIVSLIDQEVMGFEALVRWEHPVRGLIMPDEFIQTLEENGSIVEVGEWVLRRACAQLVEWMADGRVCSRAVIHVNISARQLVDATFHQRVSRVLSETGLCPQQLCLEMTESMLLRRDGHAHRQLNAVLSLGVQCSIDDFGTGYSSLALLQQVKFTGLKIDRSFVARMVDDARHRSLVEATVRIAHAFGIETVAEGVEDSAQVALLLELGCTSGQGYLFGRPQDVSAVALLR